MLAVLLLLAAAILLVVGYIGEEPDLVRIALGASMVAAVLVLAPRLVGTFRSRGAAPDSSPDPSPDSDLPIEDAPLPDVVFVPGRLTFHAASCPALGGKTTSSAHRAQLEAGGMKPCRRCLD